MKKLIGALVKFVIAAVVIAFLGLKSLDFFYFVTPADQWYYAYLGFGLTGGATIAYLIIFLWDADTDLKRTIAVVMLVFSVLGELASAGFGLQINAWQKNGWQMLASDFEWMVLVIQIIGFAHAAALILYTAGDQIAWAFQDDDHDGTINALDPVDNRTNQPTQKPKWSLFRKKKEVVRQPEQRPAFTPEQLDQLMKFMQEHGVGQGNGANGQKPIEDPTQRQRP